MQRLDHQDYTEIEKPLWFHRRNLMQTATGYGKKLVSSKMIRLTSWGMKKTGGTKRLYRVYVCCFSNSGTSYVIINRQKTIID